MNKTTLFGIKNCDSVKKAKKWLTQANIEFDYHDFRTDGIDIDHINAWLTQIDWQILLNKRGTSFRQLDEKIKADLNRDNIADLLLANPTLIKRPVVEYQNTYSVGFKAQEFIEKFSNKED